MCGLRPGHVMQPNMAVQRYPSRAQPTTPVPGRDHSALAKATSPPGAPTGAEPHRARHPPNVSAASEEAAGTTCYCMTRVPSCLPRSTESAEVV